MNKIYSTLKKLGLTSKRSKLNLVKKLEIKKNKMFG